MSYKPLKIIKFMNKGNSEAEYLKRYDGFGTVKTQLFPRLVKRGSFASDQIDALEADGIIKLTSQRPKKHILS